MFAHTSSGSLVLFSLGVAALAVAGCGGSTPAAPTSTAAAVAGPADVHCLDNGVQIKQAVGMCEVENGAMTSALSADDAGADAGTADGGADGASTDGGGDDAGATSDYGVTLFNAEGDDDDCKYHVSWKSTAVKQNTGVTFDVDLVRLLDEKAATAAEVRIEAYLNDHHPTPSLNIRTDESAGGKYTVGPVVFDAPGQWTVRFHFYEMCSDEPEDSPHGHAAFFVNVP